MMFFSEKFISQVEANPVIGIIHACDMALDALKSFADNEQGWNEKEHELLWESAGFVQLVIDAEGLEVPIKLPETSGDIQYNCAQLFEYLDSIKGYFEAQTIRLKVESYKGRYKTAFRSSFAYEFSEGDLKRIQKLVNELRNQIADSQALQGNHRQRLLNRLEKLQSELHKRVSDLDRFWGLVGDAGVVLGKLGKDAKPIVDQIREISEIVWRTQSRSEELPSDSTNPMIEHKENS
jgi:hypothetical protein